MAAIPALPNHLAEYLIEATLLGTFMVSACCSTALVLHPASPVSRAVSSPLARRAIIGAAMAFTAIVLITSALGRRSGAHMNPATTLAYLSLGKIAAADALGYIVAQFVGGALGVGLARLALNSIITHTSVRCVVTQPPSLNAGAVRTAWLAEFIITLIMFLSVLVVSNSPDLAAYTPLLVGILILLYITFEAPLSGMSMNPARSLASAIHARQFRTLWVYFTAPPLAMLLAAALYTSTPLGGHVYCAKLDHRGDHPCPFNCEIGRMRASAKPIE